MGPFFIIAPAPNYTGSVYKLILLDSRTWQLHFYKIEGQFLACLQEVTEVLPKEAKFKLPLRMSQRGQIGEATILLQCAQRKNTESCRAVGKRKGPAGRVNEQQGFYKRHCGRAQAPGSSI